MYAHGSSPCGPQLATMEYKIAAEAAPPSEPAKVFSLRDGLSQSQLGGVVVDGEIGVVGTHGQDGPLVEGVLNRLA